MRISLVNSLSNITEIAGLLSLNSKFEYMDAVFHNVVFIKFNSNLKTIHYDLK